MQYDGHIDPLIVRDALVAWDRWPPDEPACTHAVPAVPDHYIQAFLQGLSEAPYRPLPGARHAVHCARDAGAIVGLATGTMAEAAHARLASAGLGDLFHSRAAGGVGGYGEDGTRRTEVVRRAISKAERVAEGTHPVWVVGDTPRDVTAGHAAGARVSAVATGSYSRDDLRGAGADAVFDTLVDLVARPPWIRASDSG